MLFRILPCFIALFFLFLPTLQAGGKKPPPARIGFHFEGHRTDGNKLVIGREIYGQTRYFQIAPYFSLKDVAAFRSFPADKNQGYGLIFQLKKSSHIRLRSITTDKRGSWMLCLVNGRLCDAVMIDRGVTDGTLVIWKNATLADIRSLDWALPRIGESPERWKQRRKELKKSLKKKS